MKEIRILTLKEPYAGLMLPPFNKIETRTWKTDYRGLVCIHVAKQSYSDKQAHAISGNQYGNVLGKAKYNFKHNGLVIAIAELIDCRPMTPNDAEKCFVQYKEGLWCHVYQNVIEIPPFPYKGKQGWGKMDPDYNHVIENYLV